MKLEHIQSVLHQKTIAVLATVGGTRPHCSLMAFTTDRACREIYMYTRRDTKKYANLINNPAVSILIDTRDDSSRSVVQAVTATGEFDPIDDPQRKSRIKDRFLSVHPHLAKLVENSATELLRFRIGSYLLLDGPEKAYFVDLQPDR